MLRKIKFFKHFFKFSYRKRLTIINRSVIKVTYTRDPSLYPEMKIKDFFKYSSYSPGPLLEFRQNRKILTRF